MIAGKSENMYDELFDVVSQHVSGPPLSITVDFEKAVETIIKQKLPTTSISGCFFFISRNVFREKYKCSLLDHNSLFKINIMIFDISL